MNIAIIISERDPAGMNIKQQLLKNYGFVHKAGSFSLQIEDSVATLHTVPVESFACESIDREIAADLFVFATRHQSRASVPALTAHAVGNWSNADFGGRPGVVCKTSPSLLKFFLENLGAAAKSSGYNGQVVQEATHHGPFIEKPSVFIEVGSSEKEWGDEHLASLVADSLVGGLGDFVVIDEIGEKHIPAVGLGGPHYASNFSKLLGTDTALGHVCPKHHLPFLTASLLHQALQASDAAKVVLDWKGLGPEKSRVLSLLAQEKIAYERL